MDDADVWTMLWNDFALRLLGAAVLGFAIGYAPDVTPAAAVESFVVHATIAVARPHVHGRWRTAVDAVARFARVAARPRF